MTVGQLIECLLGKVCSLEGIDGDGTPYTHKHPDTVAQMLEDCGFSGSGKEVLFHGHTGKPLKEKFFIGPTFYQRLKHMVKDKKHARRKGPISNLTRQPVEGRARDGGLRFGKHIAEKWNVKVLLVCDTAGNATKFRGSLVYALRRDIQIVCVVCRFLCFLCFLCFFVFHI